MANAKDKDKKRREADALELAQLLFDMFAEQKHDSRFRNGQNADQSQND